MAQKLPAHQALTENILQRWPSRKALAEDMGKDIVVIHRWHQRRSIPPEYFQRMLDAAPRHDIDLAWHELIASRRPHTDQGGHTPNIRQDDGAKQHTGEASA